MIIRKVQLLFGTMLAAVLLLCGAGSVIAQDQGGGSGDPALIRETGQEINDGYAVPSIKNLARMYWKLGKLSIDDNQAVDNFMLLTNCDMYLQYYNDDIEWNKIREASRKYITSNLEGMPDKFEIMSVLSVGRYDIDRQVFSLENVSQIRDLRRLDYKLNDATELGDCMSAVRKSVIPGYEFNVMLIFDKPLTLTEIPVRRELAKLYLEDLQEENNVNTQDIALQMYLYKRTAFLRLKVQIIQFKDVIDLGQDGERATFYARVDGLEIYADTDRQKLLYEKNFTQHGGRLHHLSLHESSSESDSEN